MTQTEIARKIGINQSAINRWMKKPEWIEIEERLKEEKARAFMENYNKETKETFKRLQENAEKLAFAFAQDAASSLKIAQIAKKEALEKVESNKLSPLKASEKTISTTYHQRAASSSSRESREIAEQFYCISKIIEVMDKEGLLNEEDESEEIPRDDGKDDSD